MAKTATKQFISSPNFYKSNVKRKSAFGITIKNHFQKEMQERAENMFDPNRSGPPIELKKMRPLKKSTIIEMYQDLGVAPDNNDETKGDSNQLQKFKTRMYEKYELQKLKNKLYENV